MHLTPITGYPGYYVTKFGEVYSRISRCSRPGPPIWYKKVLWKKNGYWAVTLHVPKHVHPRRQVNVYVHRLVLETFVGKCPPGMECLHKDGNKGNCRLANLRWDTRVANRSDMKVHGSRPIGETHGLHRLTRDNVLSIRRMLRQGVLHRDIALTFGIHKSTVSHIAVGSTWGWLK